MVRGFLHVSQLWIYCSLVNSTPLLLSFTLSLLPPIIQQISVWIFTSFNCTDEMCFTIVDFLTFSIPFPPHLNSIEKFHNYKLYINAHMIMLFLSICLSFGSIFHMWKKSYGLCLSEPGLLHLTWCPQNCFHLLANSIISFFFIVE
jgi:hypothetical protein